MGKNSNEKKSVIQSVGELRNIFPPELTNASTLQVVGSRELTIDGCRGIVEYSDYSIKIKTTDGTVMIEGHSLNIKYLSVSSVVIEGRITGIDFLDRG